MERLQLKMEPKLLRVPVSFNDPSPLLFGRGKKVSALNTASWSLKMTTFRNPVSAPALYFLRVTGSRLYRNDSIPRNRGDADLAGLLSNAFTTHGISIPKSKIYAETDDIKLSMPTDEDKVTQDAWNYFLNAVQWAKDNKVQPTTIFIIILPNKDPYIFQAIKRAADYWGFRTICVVSNKVDMGKTRGEYPSNLCLKMNARAGNDVHQVERLNQLTDTIVLGADIGTVKGGATGCPAVAAVVGSANENHINAPGSMRLIPAKQDVSAPPFIQDHC